jgi:hypothetical protein
MRSLLVGWMMVLSVGLVSGQTPEHVPAEDCPMKKANPGSPYSGFEGREIKALSDGDREGLLAGHGMGLALAAELNRFPGPKHVLQLADDLALSKEQVSVAQEIFEEMGQRARTLGRTVIEKEAALDARFAAAKIDQQELARAVREIGRLRGELRLAHLRAHLQMRAAMNDDQIATYDSLRGYLRE